VYCPRCGTPNEPGDRFCSSCGAELREAPSSETSLSPRERVTRLVGTTRRARIATAATVGAVVVAIAAFVALKPSEETTIPRDAYTLEADQMCLDAKRQIVAAERAGGANPFSALVAIVGSWRLQLQELKPPRDRIALAQQLETALLEAEIRIAKVARLAPRESRKEILTSAKRADEAAAQVEEAVAALGLSECAGATIGFSPEPS